MTGNEFAYWQLCRDPFGKGVPAGDAYETADLAAACARLDYLRRVGGVGLLTARPGYGKTLALRRWSSRLNRNECDWVYICLSTVTTMEFYRQLCQELGLDPAYKKVDMFRSVQAHLRHRSVERGAQTVVLLDEAHHLSPDILRDLVMLTNFEMDSRSCCAFALVGQSHLADQLCRGSYEALRQRVVASYEFQGLSEEEAVPWAAHMLRAAGGSASSVDEAAVRAAARASGGSARVAGRLLSTALMIGAQRGDASVTAETVMLAEGEVAIR